MHRMLHAGRNSHALYNHADLEDLERSIAGRRVHSKIFNVYVPEAINYYVENQVVECMTMRFPHRFKLRR